MQATPNLPELKMTTEYKLHRSVYQHKQQKICTAYYERNDSKN